MKSHSKFFNKSYYKMGEPFIGKKSDILNKLAIAALFRDQPKEAEDLWSEAIDKYPNHFETRVNFEMY
jgi:TolA-binding protein